MITYLEVQSSPIKENSVKSQKKSQKKLVGEMGETISMKKKLVGEMGETISMK